MAPLPFGLELENRRPAPSSPDPNPEPPEECFDACGVKAQNYVTCWDGYYERYLKAVAPTDPDELNSARPAIRIQGTRGEIQVDGPAFRPERYRIIRKKVGDVAVPVKEVECPFPGNGKGMYWEADEVARCIRDGKLESETLPWEESIVIMEVMDEVRKQGGLTYPESIESTVYPLKL